VATLGTIAGEAALAEIGPPTTLVIGSVVATGAQVLAAMNASSYAGFGDDDAARADRMSPAPPALRVIPNR
jgi:hypothetical protein